MNVKSGNSTEEWVDPDDAPELDEEFFEEGIWSIGGAVATREEVQAAWARDAKKAADETSFHQLACAAGQGCLTRFRSNGRRLASTAE